jgi:Zn-dependent protease
VDFGDFGLLGILQDDPVAFVLLAGALVGALALHEYAHALAADLQGDRLPRAMGRLTPNPAKHLDPLGTVCILLVGFGWGKPVEFRPQALSSKRFGAAIVALAGPLMNLALALLAAFAFVPLCNADAACLAGDASDGAPLVRFAGVFMAINVLLAVFNLVPLPPLDGSRLLTIFLPPSKQKVIFFLDRYGFLILLALVFFGGTTLLEPVIETVGRAILALAGG